MATNQNDEFRDPEYERAFAEGGNTSSDGDDFGLMPGEAEQEAAERTAAAPEDPDDGGQDPNAGAAPAAVVIVAEEAPGTVDAQQEASANDSAAAEAKQVNDANNAAAVDNKSENTSTGEQEAGKSAPEGSAAEEAAETPKEEAAEVAAGQGDAGTGATAAGDKYDLSDVPPEDMQKAKSWVGRLKKIEADLKAKADAAASGAPGAGAPGADGTTTEVQAANALEEVADRAEAKGDPEQAQTVAEVADQVKSGELSPQEAMKMLAEDFGEDFVRMIEIVARSAAGGAVDQAMGDRLGKLEQSTQDVISHLTDSAQRSHFEQIFDAHPDFMEVAKDPAFQAFVQQQGAEDVVENGSARQINKLLSQFKDSKPVGTEQAAADTPAQAAPAADAATAQPAQNAVAAAKDAVDQGAVDAAEGVRSAGLRLPEPPVRSNRDDFASAWEQF